MSRKIPWGASMRTQADVEQSIRNQLPILFGKKSAVDTQRYLEKRKAVAEYATAVSEPFLNEQTLRYQSMLLYISLIFVSVHLLNIAKLKIEGQDITVDTRLLALYSILIGLIAIIFVIKAYVDRKRAYFVRGTNDHAILELRELIGVGLVKKQIQHYFWLEIYDAIGLAYQSYQDAGMKSAGGVSDFKHRPVQFRQLDRVLLGQNPELASELSAQDTYLSQLKSQLAADEASFRADADAALAIPAPTFLPPDAYVHARYDGVRMAYERWLSPWLEGRNHLNDEHLSHVLEGVTPEIQQLDAMVDVLKHIVGIRRIYAWLEIVGPILFAVLCLLFVWGEKSALWR